MHAMMSLYIYIYIYIYIYNIYIYVIFIMFRADLLDAYSGIIYRTVGFPYRTKTVRNPNSTNNYLRVKIAACVAYTYICILALFYMSDHLT